MRTLLVTRYVTPLREGGSLPAIVEAEDQGLYVLKFRGAGQGIKALIAEGICAGLARAFGLSVPEVVLATLEPALARTEPHDEIRDLLKASIGLNLAMDYLPGSITFDPLVAPAPDPAFASDLVCFDAFVTNVDRTAKNPNLLMWHKRPWLIDHGAALYFHHSWDDPDAKSRSVFQPVRQHVLLPWASQLNDAHQRLTERLSESVFRQVLAEIPDEWLCHEPFTDPAAHRAAYVEYFTRRLAASHLFVEEALRARSQLL